jgi:hypothetical protein
MKLVKECLTEEESSFNWIKVSDRKRKAYDKVKEGVFDFLDFKLDNSVRRENVWYGEDGKWLFEQDDKNDRLWISYNKIWKVLESKYGLNYNEAKQLITTWMEKHNEWHTLTPICF